VADRIGGALLTVALGFVTGAFGAAVFIAYVLRRVGDPRAQGRRAAVTICLGAAVFVGMAVYTIASPWID